MIIGHVQATPAALNETVVYLENVPGTYPPRTETLDQKSMTFVPHVLVITQGDTVDFLNHDTVAHNVFSPDGETYNLGTFKPNETRTYTFKRTGVYTQLCSLHSEMEAFIFVGQNPFAATVDEQGAFTIKDVPPGTYTIEVWSSSLKAAPQKVTVTAGGRANVDFALHR